MVKTLDRERIRANEAAAILGIQLRTVQAMAARGELPGAAKIGGSWTFNEAVLREWVRQEVEKTKARAQNVRGQRALDRDSIHLEYERAFRKLRGKPPLSDKDLVDEVKRERARRAQREERARLRKLAELERR
jgi:excisionase family DNA binding protein